MVHFCSINFDLLWLEDHCRVTANLVCSAMDRMTHRSSCIQFAVCSQKFHHKPGCRVAESFSRGANRALNDTRRSACLFFMNGLL